jgi:hypothetical protein
LEEGNRHAEMKPGPQRKGHLLSILSQFPENFADYIDRGMEG